MSKKKYLIIDAIIILIISIGIFLFLEITKNKSDELNGQIVYKILVKDCNIENYSKIKIGDVLYDDLTGTNMGRVVNISKSNSYSYVFNDVDGVYIKNVEKNKLNCYVELVSDVFDGNVNLLIGEYDVKIGKNVDLMSDNYSLYGTIIDIDGDYDDKK